MTDFTCASDLLKACYESVVACKRGETQIERMKAAEGVRGARITGTASGAPGDRMAGVDARLDFEKVLEARRANRDLLCSECMALLYGADGRGGLASMYGDGTKVDALYFRYVRGMDWRQAATTLDRSLSTVKAHAREVIDLADSLGIERAKAGTGLAS